jgi:hypothetical protein
MNVVHEQGGGVHAQLLRGIRVGWAHSGHWVQTHQR